MVRSGGRLAIILSVVSALMIGTVVGSPASPAMAATAQDDIATQTNAHRWVVGQRDLMRDASLDAAAQEWADQMAASRSMTHSSNAFRAARIPAGWDTHGENIAWGHNSTSSVMKAWLESIGHRDNILRPAFTRIGVGYSASGNFWVQIFAGYPADRLPEVTTAPTPKIQGTAKAGQTITVDTGAWGPGEVTKTIQWKSNGVAIPGSNASTFQVKSTDVGAQITASVTGTGAGYRPTTRTSSPVTIATNLAVSRIDGADRFAVATSVSAAAFPGQAATVFVASGANYPDALGAAPAAVKLNAPLLLTSPNDLPASTRAEIERLDPTRIVVVGGPASVSDTVFADLQGLAPEVRRISGADRFDVSRELARFAFGSGSTTGYVSTGLNFPDALSAGSAAGKSNAPVILVNGGAPSLDEGTSSLIRGLGLQSVKIAGGERSVSPGVANSLSTLVRSVSRLSGSDRWAASVSINADAYSSAPIAYVATGQNFPDALAGSVLAGKQRAPLFVVPSYCIPRSVIGEFDRLGVKQVVLIGGPASLDGSARALAACSF